METAEAIATPGESPRTAAYMKAFVYHGPGKRAWDRNIALTTRLVDTITTPMLLKVVKSGKLQLGRLVTHRFQLSDVMTAYDTFGNAAKEGALKVILRNGPVA